MNWCGRFDQQFFNYRCIALALFVAQPELAGADFLRVVGDNRNGRNRQHEEMPGDDVGGRECGIKVQQSEIDDRQRYINARRHSERDAHHA